MDKNALIPSIAPRDLLPSRERCGLLVVDVQERLLPAMPKAVAENVLRNTMILLQVAREFSLPIAASEQYPQGLGHTAAEVKALFPDGLAPFEKVVFSCCLAPGCQSVLDILGERDVILCGIETHVCVLQTGLDLLAAGRRVYVAADATCSRAKLNWRTGLDLLRRAGAVISTTEIIAFSLLGTAGTEQFRRISRLVK